MKIVVFTGAGISKESGLDTFRKGGLWDGMSLNEVANIQSWWAGPESQQKMLDFYNTRRSQCHGAEPNGAHLAIAELEAAGHTVTIITQNIDNLHERAGSTRVLHLHGEIMKVRPEDDIEIILDWTEDLNLGHQHGRTQLRPHVVWFGEGLPAFDIAYQAATEPDVDVLMIVGTTLGVSPANLCAFHTKAKQVYIVDPEPPEFGTSITFGGRLTEHPNCRVFPTTAVVGIRQAIEHMLS